ncbi:hypothetical protein ABZP36_017590 [Zizania latifolia]
MWAAAVSDGRRADPTSSYTVAQYNSPFEFSGRVNEIWMLFDSKDAADILLYSRYQMGGNPEAIMWLIQVQNKLEVFNPRDQLA